MGSHGDTKPGLVFSIIYELGSRPGPGRVAGPGALGPKPRALPPWLGARVRGPRPPDTRARDRGPVPYAFRRSDRPRPRLLVFFARAPLGCHHWPADSKTALYMA